MRVTEYLTPSAEKLLEELPIARSTLDLLVETFSNHVWKIDDRPRARQVKDLLAGSPVLSGWNGPGHRIDKNLLPKDLKALVTVDYQSINNSSVLCIFTLEVMTDNKQAVPTNLMKFQLAENFANGDVPHLGIGIVFSKEHDLIAGGGNRRGVAWSGLYETALRSLYNKTIHTPVALITLGL
jgi:hypothetical protein